MNKKIDVNIGRMFSRTMEKETDKKRKEKNGRNRYARSIENRDDRSS